MSFLNLCGEKYICENCGEVVTVQIERKGEYQIGDMAVLEQEHANKALNSSFSSKDGHYYCHSIICEACAKHAKRPLFLSEADAYVKSLDQIAVYTEELQNYCSSYTDNFWNAITFEVLMDILSQAIKDTQNTHDTKKQLLKKRHERIRVNLTDLLYQGFLETDNYTSFKKDLSVLVKNVIGEAKKVRRNTIFNLIDVMEPHNLNPYIQTDMTVSNPVAKDKSLAVYISYSGKELLAYTTETLGNYVDETDNQLQSLILDHAKCNLKKTGEFLKKYGISEEMVLSKH